jgi:hypothetical protein
VKSISTSTEGCLSHSQIAERAKRTIKIGRILQQNIKMLDF